ncbi:MAG: nitrilase-related carbon-nitrogen hydrolase [Candidatus Aminicenantales bacterium]
MKIALAQIAPKLGDVEANIDTHLEIIDKARKQKVDLVCFPELGLTGYTLKDLVEEVALDPASDPRFRRIVAATKGLSAVVGFVLESPEDRGLYYNAAAFIADGKVVHVHRKVFLPTGGIFEEAKFFAPGRDFRTFKAPFGRAGLLICRDFLQYGSSYVHYASGADLIICISAGPGRGVAGGQAFETSRMWELMGEAVSYFSTAFVLYANRVGSEDGVTFAGGSFVFAPGGRLVARGSSIDPELVVCRIDLADVREGRRKWLFKRDEKPETIWRSLERIVRAPED